MTKFTGSGLTVTFGTLITANLIRDVSIDESIGLVESTGAGDTAESLLSTGIKKGTCTVNFIADSDNASVVDKFEPGTSNTLAIVLTGSEGITGTAIVESRNVAVGYNSLAVGTAVLRYNGAITQP